MTKQASLNKGWAFTFNVEGLDEDNNPVRVVILGEVGDVAHNTWQDESSVWYTDDEHAASIATDAVTDKFEVGRDTITLLGIRDYEPNDMGGLKKVDIGVWI